MTTFFMISTSFRLLAGSAYRPGGLTCRAFLDREIEGVAFVANLIQRYQPDVFCLALGSISSPPPGKLPVVVRDQQLRGMVSSSVERFLAQRFDAVQRTPAWTGFG